MSFIEKLFGGGDDDQMRVPRRDDNRTDEIAAQIRKRAALAQGRQSTILGSATGQRAAPAELGVNTLLGGGGSK